MTYLLALSKSGRNVLTATNPNDFIFNSSYNTFKIIARGTASFTIPLDIYNYTYCYISHNMSYTPFVFLFIKWSDGLTGMAGTNRKNYYYVFNIDTYVDTRNIVVVFYNGEINNENVVISYIICEPPF